MSIIACHCLYLCSIRKLTKICSNNNPYIHFILPTTLPLSWPINKTIPKNHQNYSNNNQSKSMKSILLQKCRGKSNCFNWWKFNHLMMKQKEFEREVEEKMEVCLMMIVAHKKGKVWKHLQRNNNLVLTRQSQMLLFQVKIGWELKSMGWCLWRKEGNG